MPKPRKKTRKDFSWWYKAVVKLVWEDVLYAEEIAESEIHKEPDLFFTSYGEIVGKTDRNLTLACTIAQEPRDRTLREVIRVPLSLIKQIILLEEGEEVKL